MRTEIERDLAALAAILRASTVAVRASRGAGSGSGVVWSPETIVTNAHVAQTATAEIETADGRRLRGTVDRRDERRDLALVRVDADDLAPAAYRDPRDLRVGEFVVAFGHPLGNRNVLSTGIVHARHRAGADRFVRADLKLEPGNSGGALADARGRVIGINSMIAGGVALAIPADEVRRFATGDALPAPRLGVRLAPARLGDRRDAYAVIAIEPHSAAQRSGIIVGDIILARDATGLGAARSLDVLRGGTALSIEIVAAQSRAAAAA
jgi:serine protease Do